MVMLNDILEKEELREDILNNNRSLNIMEEYKTITTIKNMEYETVDRVAKYFEVSKKTLESLISRHREELIKNGLISLKCNELKDNLATFNMEVTNYRGYFIADNRKFNNRSNILINKRCFLNIAMLLTESKVAEEIRSKILDIVLNGTENIKTKTIIDNSTEELFRLFEESFKKDKQLIQDLQNKIKQLENEKVLEVPKRENLEPKNKFEKMINDLPNDIYTIDDFIVLVNKNMKLPKLFGKQYFNSLMVDNGLYVADVPSNFENGYFIRERLFINKGAYVNKITKKGMIKVSRIIKQQFNEDYKIER